MQTVKSKSNSTYSTKSRDLVLPHITLKMYKMLKCFSSKGPHLKRHFDVRVLNALFARKLVKRDKGYGENAVLIFTIRGKRLWQALR